MSTDKTEQALPTEEQVVAAARVLNKRAADACNVDEADSWQTYGEEYKDDAREALRAALTAAPPAQQQSEPLKGWKLVPAWKLRRAAEILDRDGDENGIAADLWSMLADAAPIPARAAGGGA